MSFEPDEDPWTILPRKFAASFVGPVVIGYSSLKIVCVADVKFASWILKNVGPEHLKFGSRGRIRTYDQSVNSRPLYH